MITQTMAQELISSYESRETSDKKCYDCVFLCQASRSFDNLWNGTEFRNSVKNQFVKYLEDCDLSKEWTIDKDGSVFSYLAESTRFDSFLYTIDFRKERNVRINFLKWIIANANT